MDIKEQKTLIAFMLRLSSFLDTHGDNTDAHAVYMSSCGFALRFDPSVIEANILKIRQYLERNTYEYRNSGIIESPSLRRRCLIENAVVEFIKGPYAGTLKKVSEEKFGTYVADIMQVVNDKDVSLGVVLNLRDEILDQGLKAMDIGKIKLAALIDSLRNQYTQLESSLTSKEVEKRIAEVLGAEDANTIRRDAVNITLHGLDHGTVVVNIISENAQLLKCGSKDDVQLVIEKLANSKGATYGPTWIKLSHKDQKQP